MTIRPIESLTREEAINQYRVEQSTSDFLRSQVTEMREQIQALEEQLAEANRVIELRGAANMRLCEEYEQLRRKLEAIGAGGVEMMGVPVKDGAYHAPEPRGFMTRRSR